MKPYHVNYHPHRGISNRPEPKGRERYLSESEQTALLTACKNQNWDKLYLLVLLALTTGARKGELLALNWGDLSFNNKIAYIAESKNGHSRVLPLTQNVITELIQIRQFKGLIFQAGHNNHKTFEFKKQWLAALNGADIADFRFHDLRHSCASNLARNGVILFVIADTLGHKSIQTTMRYSHLCIERKQA